MPNAHSGRVAAKQWSSVSLAAGLQGGSTGGNLCRRHSRLPLHTLSEWAWMMVGVGSGLASLSTDDSVSFL